MQKCNNCPSRAQCVMVYPCDASSPLLASLLPCLGDDMFTHPFSEAYCCPRYTNALLPSSPLLPPSPPPSLLSAHSPCAFSVSDLPVPHHLFPILASPPLLLPPTSRSPLLPRPLRLPSETPPLPAWQRGLIYWYLTAMRLSLSPIPSIHMQHFRRNVCLYTDSCSTNPFSLRSFKLAAGILYSSRAGINHLAAAPLYAPSRNQSINLQYWLCQEVTMAMQHTTPHDWSHTTPCRPTIWTPGHPHRSPT